jgi:hypothetical protein
MRLSILALAVAAALAAGCDRPSQPATTTNANAPAAGGSSAAPQTGPKGDEIKLPPSPGGTKDAKAQPDPGDANDHSNPQHDARSKADSGKSNDR